MYSKLNHTNPLARSFNTSQRCLTRKISARMMREKGGARKLSSCRKRQKAPHLWGWILPRMRIISACKRSRACWADLLTDNQRRCANWMWLCFFGALRP